MKFVKIVSAVMVATTLGATATVVTPKTDMNAQAKAKTGDTVSYTEVSGPDGVEYYEMNGKRYTPAQFNKVFAEQDAKDLAQSDTTKMAYKVTSLKARKTKSGKYVKVTGKVKKTKFATKKDEKPNYARIRTYKGYTYVKLSKKRTFSKSVKAPKAKVVHVDTVYRLNKVTKNGSTGTLDTLSSAKKVTVKAYK